MRVRLRGVAADNHSERGGEQLVSATRSHLRPPLFSHRPLLCAAAHCASRRLSWSLSFLAIFSVLFFLLLCSTRVMLRLCRGQTRSAVLLALRPVQATAFSAAVATPAARAHFSAAAAAASASPSSAPSVPYVFQAGVTSSPQLGVDRNVWPKSPSQLVIDVLKTGPKTRLQLFYAINRGPLAELPEPQAPKGHKKKNLLTQFPPPPPTAADVARLKAARIKAEADGSLNVAEPRRYPTGILRNTVHLTSVLQHLQRAKRVWARPFSQVEKRMGEAEFSSTRAIIEAAGQQASVLTSGMGEAAAIATMGAAAPSHGQMKKLHASQARSAAAKTADQWVYVLREWADPGFLKKAPARMEQYQRKVERREERREKDVAAAEEAGKPLILGRLPHVSRRVRRKAAQKVDEAVEKRKIRMAVKAYHAQLFPDQKKD